MSDGALAGWQEDNRRFVSAAIDVLHVELGGEPQEEPGETLVVDLEELRATMAAPPAIDALASAFDLGSFERGLVLRCLAAEVDPRFRLDVRPVTVGLVLTTLPQANWAELDAAAALRSWGIVELEPNTPLADAQLRLAPDVLRFLLGFDPRDDLDAMIDVAPAPLLDVHEHQAARVMRAAAVAMTATGEVPLVELHGATAEDRIALAALCAAHVEAMLLSGALADLPAPGAELDALLRRWARACRLTDSLSALVVGAEESSDPRLHRAMRLLRDPLILLAPRPSTVAHRRPVVRELVPQLTADQRELIFAGWLAGLAERREREITVDAGSLARLAARFRLPARSAQRACWSAEARLPAELPDGARLLAELALACAEEVRGRLDPVADRVLGTPAEVVLPDAQAALVDELADQIRDHQRVDVGWGMGAGVDRAPVALFAGPSGTGKTLAASALARRTGLDLYRVDLAGVLSKWIGETEQNLERVFEAADIGGVMLLFDEADALFGKRSEVRESRDRYANTGVSYLLQRIERTTAPVVLTTNLKDAIDPAFLRRIDVVVDVPFPAEPERESIWRGVFPPAAPVGDIAPERLARLVITGASIASIARRGAFLAAADDAEEIAMGHLLRAARLELRKLGRELSTEEQSAWS